MDKQDFLLACLVSVFIPPLIEGIFNICKFWKRKLTRKK